MKKYNIELTKEEAKLLRSALYTMANDLEDKGIKPETVEQCDELIASLVALIKDAE